MQFEMNNFAVCIVANVLCLTRTIKNVCACRRVTIRCRALYCCRSDSERLLNFLAAAIGIVCLDTPASCTRTTGVRKTISFDFMGHYNNIIG